MTYAIRFLIFPLLLLTFLTGCETPQTEGEAAATLDAAKPAARELATALVGNDVDLMRSTGLELITIVQCHPDGCVSP